MYATCPRQYEYDKVWGVETPEESRRYLDRGLVYHGVIEDVCHIVADNPGMDDAEIRAAARQRVDERWDEETSRSEYVSDAQYVYDRDVTRAGIAAYFADVGITHVRNSIGTEEWLECSRGGAYLVGRADNIVRTDEGVCVIDYKGSLRNLISSPSAEDIPAHRAGDEYIAGKLKSVFQAATYIEGAKNLSAYDAGMDVEFTFYGLLASTNRERHIDGIQVDVEGAERDVGGIYRAYEDEIWALIQETYQGIVAGEYEPTRWDDITEHACEECAYNGMCGEYLAEAVQIHE